MTNKDIRWIQRFANYNKALRQLSLFIEKGVLNEMKVQGVIQCFIYTYELAWNMIKDFYESQGEVGIQGSRDAIRLAFKRGLIEAGEVWMKMIKSRTLSSHTYNEEVAKEISEAVFNDYYSEFIELQKRFRELEEKEQN